jgi:hypothetical protein
LLLPNTHPRNALLDHDDVRHLNKKEYDELKRIRGLMIPEILAHAH